MKHQASSVVVKFSNDFKLSAIADKLPPDIRRVIVKVAGFAEGVVHRVATVNKSVLLPKPDLPRSATIYLSTRNLDADLDIVMPTGWDKSLYRGQGLWSHDYKLDPIYKAIETGADDYGLFQLIQFADSERGKDYWNMVKDGFLQTFSAGMWLKPDGAVLKSQGVKFESILALCKDWPEFTAEQHGQVERFIVNKYLIESTLCNVPANPYAMVVAVNKGELELSEGVKKEIGFEALVKKCRDAGQLEGKTFVIPEGYELVKKGDAPGHEFRGNQYTTGEGGSATQADDPTKADYPLEQTNRGYVVRSGDKHRVVHIRPDPEKEGTFIIQHIDSSGKEYVYRADNLTVAHRIASETIQHGPGERNPLTTINMDYMKSLPAVRVVPQVTVVASIPLETLVEKSLEKSIAKMRGAL